MKLTEVSLKNFLSYKDEQSFKIKNNYAMIVGPNGSGKSNIVRFLQFICQKDLSYIDWKIFPYWDRSQDSFCKATFKLSESDLKFLNTLISLLLFPQDNEELILANWMENFLNSKHSALLSVILCSSQQRFGNLAILFVLDYKDSFRLIIDSESYNSIHFVPNQSNNPVNESIVNFRNEITKRIDLQNKVQMKKAINEIFNNSLNDSESNSLVFLETLFNSNESFYLDNLRHSLVNSRNFTERKQKLVMISDTLKDLNINPEANDLYLEKVISWLLNKSLNILPEHRGLITFNDTDLNLSNITERLHDWQTSINPLDKAKFENVSKRVENLLGLKLQINLMKSTSYLADDSFILLHSDSFFGQILPDSPQATFTIHNKKDSLDTRKPIISFFDNDKYIDIRNAPGGAIELVMESVAIESESSTVIIDEMGKTIHPKKAQELRQELNISDQQSILFITHTPQFILTKDLENLIYCKRTEHGTKLTYFDQFMENFSDGEKRKWRKFFHSPWVKSMLFHENIIFVEGYDEEDFIPILIQEYENETKKKFKGDIIPILGVKGFYKTFSISKYFSINGVFLMDGNSWLDNVGPIKVLNKLNLQLNETNKKSLRDSDGIFTWKDNLEDIINKACSTSIQHKKLREFTYDELCEFAKKTLKHPEVIEFFELLNKKKFF